MNYQLIAGSSIAPAEPQTSRNASTTPTQNNGSLAISMSESAMQGKEPVTVSKKPEGNRVSASMLFVPKILFDSLPLKHAAGNLRNCWGGSKRRGSAYSLFDKFKRENKDPTAGSNRKEQRVPMMGSTTSYSQICRAGSLSVKVNRSYAAACISKNIGKKQGNTKLLLGCFGEQEADMCIQDKRVVSGLLFIGVGDVTTGFVRDEKISDPLPLPQNKNYLEMMPLEFYSLPSRSVQLSIDDSCICNERGLSKLDLSGPYHPSSSAISSPPSSSDPSRFQNAEDSTLITDKSEQDSPVSVLDKFFEDASPRPAKITTQPVKPRNQPLHINFDEPSPGQRVELHPATTSEYSSPSKKHAAEYSRKVLAASGLDWYQLALKWRHCSTDQMLDTATYTMVESESESPLETQLLFDHINEVLLDMYQPYYPWVPLGRPNSKQHVVVRRRKLVDEVINIVERNLLLREQQAPAQHQTLAVSAMEKCGRWMDISGELEDMVLEMAQEIEEEIIDEFVFEQWID